MYKLTPAGIDKVHQKLLEVVPEAYNILQEELDADTTGEYDKLKSFTDFSKFDLWLLPTHINMLDKLKTTHRNATPYTLSDLTFEHKEQTYVRVLFLFQCQPGKSIIPNLGRAWDLFDPVFAINDPEGTSATFLSYPEAAHFIDKDTAQVLRLRVCFDLDDSDLELL